MNSQRLIWIAAVVLGLVPALCDAQSRSRVTHDFYSSDMPPGTIGRMQMQSQFPAAGHVQPVKIIAPGGCVISKAVASGFNTASVSPALMGMRVSTAYRLKISDIPLMGNLALYPTVEILDRLHPPVGQEWHYPIPIEFSLEDLKLAADGNLVTRVVYLEQPRDTLVGPATPDDPQPYFNVGSREDPLKVADYLGRAVAIVHIGSRQPDPTGDDEFFVGESPVPAPAIGALQLGARPQTHARAAQVSYDAPAAARPVARSYPRTTIPSSRRRSKSKPSKVPAFNLMQSNLLESLKTQ